MTRRSRVIGGLLLAVAASARAGEPAPALVVRAERPDEQLRRLLALFDGARAASPAEALAGWRRATGRDDGLPKAEQAVIALFNPEMVAELRTLDGAEAALGFDGDRPRWAATVPGDDGTFAALATALALTDGGPEPPLPGAEAVDRLGPPGSLLMASTPAGAVALASDRDGLASALDRLAGDPPGGGDRPSGWTARLDVAALGAGGPARRRQLAEALRGLGCRAVESVGGLDGDALSVVLTGAFAAAPPGSSGAVDPSWLEWVPADRAAMAGALALDPNPGAWDAAFALADRVEMADPARARAGPLRDRLNLAALASGGVRPEADLWPLLRGVTAAALAEPGSGRAVGGLLALHAADAEAAERIVRRVVRPLAARWGRPPDVAVREATVLLAWGAGTLDAARDARDHPGRSIGPTLQAAWGEARPQRVGAVWLGRLEAVARRVPVGALAEAPPVLWWGESHPGGTRDVLRWADLKPAVRKFLDRLPLERPDPEAAPTPAGPRP